MANYAIHAVAEGLIPPPPIPDWTETGPPWRDLPSYNQAEQLSQNMIEALDATAMAVISNMKP
jgi:hypothetical protein